MSPTLSPPAVLGSQSSSGAILNPGVRPPPRLSHVDGLRGLGMLMVLAYHGWVHPVGGPIRVALLGVAVDVTAPLHLGYLGVHLFLVLSGFCLTYPLAGGELTVEPLSFWRRRARRILPPYYAALALFVLLRLATHHRVSPGDLLTHVLLIHNFWPAWLGSINGAFWFLALTAQLYLLFPLLLACFRRWGVPRTLLAVLALTLIYRTWVFTTRDLSTLGKGYFWCYALPGRVFEFVLGMAVAIQVRRRQAHAEHRAAVPGFNPGIGMAAAAVFAALGLACTCLWSPYAPPTDGLWGISFAALLLEASRPGSRVGRWLAWRPLVGLGTISYSVYLIHAPLLRQGVAMLHGRHLSPPATLLLFELGVVPLLMGVGWLFYQGVEARTGR